LKTNIQACDFLDGIHYFVYSMEIPRLSKKETEKLIKFRLKNTYPGDVENLIFVVKPNGKEKNSRIIIAVEKQYCTQPLKIPTLALCSLAKNKTGNFIYISDSMIECAIFENGILKNSVVSFYKTNEEIDTIVKQSKRDNLEDFYVDLRNGNHIILDIRQITIFLELGKTRKIKNIIVFILFMTTIISSFFMIYNQQKSILEQNSQRKKEEALIQAQKKEEKELFVKLQNLEESWLENKKNLVVAPCDIFTQLFISLPSETCIHSLNIKNNSFRFEATYKDSLIVLSNLRDNEHFYNVQLHQVKPLDAREKFTITGFIIEPFSVIDDSLLVKEKISLLENYLKQAALYKNDGFSVSSLGSLIKKLLVENNCVLDSFQCIRNNNNNELEFSIRASSYNFFKFIFSISQNNYYFPINSITIRTNREELDINFRILAGKDSEIDILSTDFIPYHIPHNFLLQITSFWTQKESQKLEKTNAIVEQTFLAVPSWIKYLGTINRDESSYVFLKDEKKGMYYKISLDKKKNPYAEIDGKEIIIYYEENRYKLRMQ